MAASLRLVRPVLALALALPLCAWAAEPTAQEIARRSREVGGLNLKDLTAELELVTVKDGRTRAQTLQTSTRKIGGRLHTLARFKAPAGVAGVTVLTVEGQGESADEIAIYLPKLKRVRKVATSQRGQAFMDTDFSYADLAGTGTRDEDVQKLPAEKVDGRGAWVLRGQAGADSPYGQVTIWVDQETSVPLKVDYLDRDGKPYKRYRTVKLARFEGRVLAQQSVMENLKSGSRTTLTLQKLEPSTLPEDAFTLRALERG